MVEKRIFIRFCISKFLVILSCLIIFNTSAMASAQYFVHMSNVDDLATLYINGAPLYKAKWGYYGVEPDWYYVAHQPGDSGDFEITSNLVDGNNTLRFTLEDSECCGTSVTIEVKKDNQVVFSDTYDEYHGSGIWYDNTIDIDTGTQGPLILISPANNATVSDNTITFDWRAVYGATSYEILVDDNPEFSSLEVHEPGIHVESLTASEYKVTNWLANNTYYWKVIAHFQDGSQQESSVWSFNYQMSDSPKAGWVPLYRYYKGGALKDHFYTTSEDQGQSALNDGYTYERIECYVSDRKFAGGTPLMRLYNAAKNSHFYTIDISQKNISIEQEGCIYEGIQGWVFSADQNGAVELHRLKQESPQDLQYFLCARDTEYSNVLANQIWQFQDDGNAGYVYPAGLREPDAHRKPQGNYGGVDMATRAFRTSHPAYDFALKAAGPDLIFRHYYNSFNHFMVPMGPGWSHSFFSYILEDRDRTFVIIKWGDGTETYFTKNDQGNYDPEPGCYSTLTRISDGINEGYDLKTKDQNIYQFRKLTVYAQSPIPGIYLINIRDRNNNTLSLNWQASKGLLLSVADSSGRKFEFSYDDANHPLLLTKVKDTSLNRFISFNYDTDGRLVTFTDARGKNTTYEYDNYDRLIKIIRPKLNYYTIDYDSDGRVSSISDETNHQSVIQSITDGTQVTTPVGNTLKFESSNYVLTKLIDGRLKPIQFEYANPLHPTLTTKVTDRLGHDTNYTYDERGNVTKITNHLRREADFTYDAQNNLTKKTDFHLHGQTGNETKYTYDANGNLTDILNPKNENSHFTYDSRGLILTYSDGRDKITSYEYDTHGTLNKIIDPEGNIKQFNYDAAGRLLWKKDAENKYLYFEKDNNDNLTRIRDQNNVSVFIDFDFNNNLEQVRWINKGVTSDTTYGYDSMDRLVSIKNPLDFLNTYTYNNDNTLNSKTDPNLQTIHYNYDSNALLQSIQYPDHSSTITRYDNGLIHTITCVSGTTTFEYNELDQIQQVTDPYGNVVQYVYNVLNNLEKIIYPGGKEVHYSYDSLNRLASIQDWLGGETSYQYDASDNLIKIARPNNTEVIYSYDDASRLVGVTDQKIGGSVICSYTYNLNAIGNHNSMTVTEPLSAAISPLDITYTHDKANRLLTAGSVSYSYDNNGNRLTSTEAGGTAFAWDHENMLTQISETSPANIIKYKYDGLNNRIARIEGINETRYVPDLSGRMSRVLAETDGSGNITAYYVYGLGLLSRIDSGGNQRFYHFNGRGDTIAITDSGGNITDSYAYDEFGKLLNSTGTTANPFKFVGRFGVMDEGNNLYFMRARFYDAKVGRFLNEDPLGFEGGNWNLYAYVGCNPLLRVDPKGMMDYGGFLYEMTDWVDPLYSFDKKSLNFLNLWSKETIKTASTEIPASALNSVGGQVVGTGFGMAVTASSPEGSEGIVQIPVIIDEARIKEFCNENPGTVECDELMNEHYRKQTNVLNIFKDQ